MTARAVVHVGLPKSGTTYLQRALWQQRDVLAQIGVFLPGDKAQEMFHAAIEVRESYEFWGRDPADIRGTWARMCQAARGAGGVTILSHELLSAAKPRQIERSVAELSGLDVHVVVTARDLGRQLLSSWQENVKNGSTQSFADFQDGVVAHLRDQDLTGAFWKFQDLEGILGRWSSAGGVEPHQVHVVVAPPSGSPPEVLWTRFAEAVGFDPDGVESPDPGRRRNETLGMEQVAVLRRLNAALDGRIRNPRYARVVKSRLAQGLLAQTDGTRPVCPPALVTEFNRLAQQCNQAIRDRGYQVHGDLEELLTPPSPTDAPHPDEVSAQRESELFATVLAELLVEDATKSAPGRREERPGRPGPQSQPPPRLAGRLRRRLRRITRGQRP